MLLQKYEELPRVPEELFNRTAVLNLKQNVGPAIRWVHASQQPEELILVLDDDFVPEPTYVERTIAPIFHDQADVVGWYGVGTDWTHYRPSQRVAGARNLRVVAGGACAFRPETLRGLKDHPLANELCTLDGGDDLWSSVVMRQNGARMVRPQGTAPLQSTEHQQDLRSIRWSRGLDSGKLFLATELFS